MSKWLTAEFWQRILEDSVEWAIGVLPGLLLILVLAFITLKLTRVFLFRLKPVLVTRMPKNDGLDASEYEKRIGTLLGIVGSALKVAIWSIVVMLMLRQLGVDITPIIAGAGIIGLAVGFGAQELVRDFISGFFMLVENQVRTGDVAIVNGTGGLVEQVGLRTIVLRDNAGVVHVFQNGKINTLANMTKEWSAMVFDIGVAYREDTDRVANVMKQVADELRADPELAGSILEPMEIMGVDAFSDSAVVIKARLKTKPIKQWQIGREYRRRLKKAFEAAGIEMPYPHRTIYWGSNIPPVEMKSGNRNLPCE